MTNLLASKSGAVAHYESSRVLENIVDDVRGSPSSTDYSGRPTCFCDAGSRRVIMPEFTIPNFATLLKEGRVKEDSFQPSLPVAATK